VSFAAKWREFEVPGNSTDIQDGMMKKGPIAVSHDRPAADADGTVSSWKL
jgi:hypothetical protein